MADTRPRWAIADILDRTDLAALLDEVTQPATRTLGPGRRWHCPLPDHDDHRASVTMHRDHHGHERWRCWSGDHRGDAIDLAMIATGRDRTDAIDWLATRARMIPDQPLPPAPARRPPARQPVEVSAHIERYVRLCERVLNGPQGQPVRDWLHTRGLTDTTIRTNRVGADPGRDYMRRPRGLPYGTTTAATFPAFDPAGHVAYVQARYLDPDTAGRKYDNPAATLAPHPRLAFPAGGHDRAGVLLVCEGIPDALIGTQAGYRTVALLGAHTPDETVAARLANHADNHDLDIAVVCDPDTAGHHAATTLHRLLHQQGLEPTIITPPPGRDLNAWALHDPAWTTQLDHALTGRSAGRADTIGIDE